MKDSEGFHYVCSKKSKRKEKDCIKWLFSEYEKQTEKLIESSFYCFVSDSIFKILSLKIDKISRLVMLGVGSFQNNSRSLTQLCLGIGISKNLGFKGKLQAYDPVFTFLDCQLLKELNIDFDFEDPSNLYDAKQPVIFYMPHCPISMYETLFKKNWTLKRLCNIFLIGNCLKTYDLTVEIAKREKYPFVFKACLIFESVLFPKTFERPETFNDLAFQWCEGIVAEKFLA